MVILSSLLFFLISATSSLSYPHDHSHSVERSILPSQWYHREEHPVHSLFRRQEDAALPPVGSDEWRSKYPTGLPEANIPQEWLDALHTAVANGRIPNITIPQLNNDSPNYGSANAAGPEICSSFYQCRVEDDIWDAPDGMIGISFDDGPSGDPSASPRLYDFLRDNKQKATHFMIGQNILYYPDMFMRAFNELEDDIAVHTWTHRHMSTLSNEQLVADLGWTVQIIHDSTGGRVPAFWRPPYGDADNRVRAIASEIFGLTTVVWNRDSADWNIGNGGYTLDSVHDTMASWLVGPKSPGLVILEHEISANDVTTFLNAYPLMKASNWTVVSIPQLSNDDWYLNSRNNTSPVEDMDIIQVSTSTSTSSTTTQASSTSTSSNVATTTATFQNNQRASASTPTALASRHLYALSFLLFLLPAIFSL